MSAYQVMVRQAQTAPNEYQAIVSAVPDDGGPAQVRRDVLATDAESRARCDFLVGLLCSELLAQGHQILRVVGDGY